MKQKLISDQTLEKEFNFPKKTLEEKYQDLYIETLGQAIAAAVEEFETNGEDVMVKIALGTNKIFMTDSEVYKLANAAMKIKGAIANLKYTEKTPSKASKPSKHRQDRTRHGFYR